MPKHTKPRAGSLQYWPRKRSNKFLPRVNWEKIEEKNSDNKNLLGFIAYKVGMTSCYVKDNTEESLTKGKKMVVPATILESPKIKIFSVRLYKNNNVVQDILSDNIDKEMKRKVKVPKQNKSSKEKLGKLKDEDYEDIRVIVYTEVKKTKIKKKPDLTEIGLGGSKEEKLNWVKENLNKELSIFDILNDINLVDIKGLTKGHGTSGPVKRFGIKLRSHKAEKGRRKVGSIGPWHPARVTFRVPMAGQLGMFTRTQTNYNVLNKGKIEEKDINPNEGWKNYGKINTEYIIVRGSVPGSKKRPLLLTLPSRASKRQSKKQFDFIEIAK